ncbi:protein phosphatase [Emiliania huxleyi CCMP1516]|uniref:Protein phosphatase n=2 Tax=Emiliania huxleyi TaxID=2903 RepID=A0A0D3KP58_EMIH1|nr:protein phosphatase [Emiliania huxleyi CCMP1516]EOD37543.1 protein phosphatase [Emiliania huxleyi CCMP1516]|eukprot:XP_005789972.1 protein phosphatase [Emiliania huxleyi CCMP1516]
MLLAVYSAPALHSGRLHVVLGGAVLPHPAKADKGGEDAFLFDDKRCLFGVADGVGGSAKNGVDPGAFSREMLERCHQAAACGVADALPDALRLASECPLSGGGGSSTLVLGQLEEGTSTLRLLNLGDSGAMVLRPAMREVSGTDAKQLWPRVVLRTQEQTHGWNWPYQTRARTFDAVGKEVDEVSTAVREGDIVLAASDGVFDNLFEDALQFLVAERLDALRDPDPLAAQAAADALAQNIAEQAKAIGGMRDLKTPFSEAAQEEGRSHKGGKVDDVAVVCGVVRSGARPPLRLGHNFGGAPCVSEERPVVTHSGAFVPPGERTRDAAPAVGERTRDAAPAHGMPLAWLDLPRNRGPERNADARDGTFFVFPLSNVAHEMTRRDAVTRDSLPAWAA